MNLIFTICCGEQHKKLSKLTLPSFINYSKKIKCNFECIVGNKSGWNEVVSLKARAIDFLKKFERVLFIDLDCYIHPEAPDIFDAHPDSSKFYIKFWEEKGFFQINSGVFIIGPDHVKIFEPCEIKEPIKSTHPIQSSFEKQLCQQLNDGHVNIGKLDVIWHQGVTDDNSEDFYIYHAHGMTTNKKKLLLKKIIQNELKL